jgi:hypothetical protein
MLTESEHLTPNNHVALEKGVNIVLPINCANRKGVISSKIFDKNLERM